MRGEHRIITFGLTDEQNEVVKANVPAKDYEVFDTDEPTDIIAIGSVAVIIQASAMDKEMIEMLFDFYSEVGNNTYETVVWLGEPIPPRGVSKLFKCYNSFSDIEDNLKYILLTAHRRTKKSDEYSEKFYYGIKIIAAIRRKPGIKTKELAELLEISPRSVQRYIAALQVAGEFIEYDSSKKGWKLMGGKSEFFGDWENPNV